MSDAAQNKERVRALVRAINARDWPAMDRIVAEDFVRHSHAAPPIASRAALKRYLKSEFETFPDAEETIEDMIAEGDKVAVRHGFRGTQSGPLGRYPPTGKVMAADYLAIYRISREMIVEAWVEWDNLAGLVQLGHVRKE